MNHDREAFLAGDRPDAVAIYVSEDAIDDPDRLAAYGERLEDGILLVVDGDRGRNAFSAATGTDPMAFARRAMETDGDIDRKLTAARCPEATGSGATGTEATADDDLEDDGSEPNAGESDHEHELRYLFAFAEAQTDAVGGIYAEGDVIHAYAQCSCGTAYSDRWVVE